MAYVNNNQSDSLPLNNIWDIQAIQSVDVNSQDFKELLVNLYQRLSKVNNTVNTLDSGRHPLFEIINNQEWFIEQTNNFDNTNRENYRMTVDFGALPNNTSKSVPHGIEVTEDYTWTFVSCSATDPVGLLGIHLNYQDTTGNIAFLSIDATNVTITTNADFSNYTRCIIVLEYLKY